MKTNVLMQGMAMTAALVLPAVSRAQDKPTPPALPKMEIEVNGKKVDVAKAWGAIEAAMDEAKVPEETRQKMMLGMLQAWRGMEAGGDIKPLREMLRMHFGGLKPEAKEQAAGDKPEQEEKQDKPAAPGQPEGKPAPAPWKLGILCEPVDELLGDHLGLPAGTGLAVREVLDNSPAAKAGIGSRDVLAGVNGKPLKSFEMLVAAVRESGSTGKPLELKVIHGGKGRAVVIRPEGPPAPPAPPEQARRPRGERPQAGDWQAMRERMREQMKQFEGPRGMPFAEGARMMRETRAMLEAQQRELKTLKERLAKQEQQLQQLRKELSQRQADRPAGDRRHAERPDQKDRPEKRAEKPDTKDD